MKRKLVKYSFYWYVFFASVIGWFSIMTVIWLTWTHYFGQLFMTVIEPWLGTGHVPHWIWDVAGSGYVLGMIVILFTLSFYITRVVLGAVLEMDIDKFMEKKDAKT